VASASEGLFSIISEVIIKFDVEARTASNRLLHACISSISPSLMTDEDREQDAVSLQYRMIPYSYACNVRGT
jgi:hypothetical protein